MAFVKLPRNIGVEIYRMNHIVCYMDIDMYIWDINTRNVNENRWFRSINYQISQILFRNLTQCLFLDLLYVLLYIHVWYILSTWGYKTNFLLIPKELYRIIESKRSAGSVEIGQKWICQQKHFRKIYPVRWNKIIIWYVTLQYIYYTFFLDLRKHELEHKT